MDYIPWLAHLSLLWLLYIDRKASALYRLYIFLFRQVEAYFYLPLLALKFSTYSMLGAL